MWWADFYIRRVHSKISTIISFWMDTTKIDVIEWKWWWNEEKNVALNVFLFCQKYFFSAKITYIQNNDALTSSLWKKKKKIMTKWTEMNDIKARDYGSLLTSFQPLIVKRAFNISFFFCIHFKWIVWRPSNDWVQSVHIFFVILIRKSKKSETEKPTP